MAVGRVNSYEKTLFLPYCPRPEKLLCMNNGEDQRSFIRALRERGLGGLAVVYLAVGFGLIEAMEIAAPRLQLPASSVDLVLAAVLFTFPLALSLRWITEGRNSVTAVHPIGPAVSLVAITILSGWLGVRALMPSDARAGDVPLVVLMDSHHPARVYDEETLAANATNADVLSDVLLDLPIRRQRESISPEWRRDEEILQFDPDLIVIHYSGFRLEDGSGPRERLRLLISFFTDTDTQFLIYSRTIGVMLQNNMESLLVDLEAENPGLLERVSVFGLDDYGARSWLSPLTTNPLKLRVKQMLNLP